MRTWLLGSSVSEVSALPLHEAVQVLLGDDTEKFMHRYMNDCQRTRYCDVTTAPWPCLRGSLISWAGILQEFFSTLGIRPQQ